MKISVITPSFNSSNTIERAILSVINQDYNNIEHIVVDNNSSDGTLEIINKYPSIKVISECDNGQSDAMNKGFAISTGQIIVYLNADDEFLPNIFNTVVQNFIAEKSDNLLLLFKLNIIDSSRKITVFTPSLNFSDIIDVKKQQYPYNPVSYFYSRGIQEKIGQFPIHIHYTMDFWFLLRAYKMSKIKLLPIVSGNFHNYNNKTSIQRKADFELCNVALEYYVNNIIHYYFTPNFYKYHLKKLTLRWFQ